MIYKAEGIIIKTRNFSEADKIIVLLAKNKGRIEAIAKGARKSTSKKTALIDLAAYGDFRIATGKSLDIITEVKLINGFEAIKNNLQSAGIVYYLLDVIDRFFSHPEQGEEIIKDLLDTLAIINDAKELDNKLKALYLMLVKLLDKTGFLDVTGLETDRTKKIVQFAIKSNLITCMKLKLEKEDLKALDQYTFTQISEVVQKRFKSYEFLKTVL